MDVHDIMLDGDDDLIIEDGDFAISESTNQHIKHILKAYKGEFKQFPELGVGFEDMLENELYQEIIIEAKKNLEYDGLEVDDISFTEDQKIYIDGRYKKK